MHIMGSGPTGSPRGIPYDRRSDMPEPVRHDVYGHGDASFKAAGGEPGVRRLVDDFYRIMGERADARRIFEMHPTDIGVSRDKLARFLCGWLGGPKLYSAKYGPIRLPPAHAHLDIGAAEHDAWLACMQEAISLQPFADDFKSYLLAQLRVPAARIRQVCGNRAGSAQSDS